MQIENSNFKTSIPNLNPLSMDYRYFWREERRKCIEGLWVGGRYMPGPVYQYVNHWKIELNKFKNSKQKVIDHPFLRDLEWEKGRLFLEARGFSGFEFDTKYHCNREYQDLPVFWDDFEKVRIFDPLDLEYYYNNNRRYFKIDYLPARQYLQMDREENLGKPLMENEAKNVVDLEARGGGKSFFASNLIGWNFLHDGMFDYDELIRLNKAKTPAKSETLIGAIDTKYSNGLINKVKLGFENLSGGIELGDKYYPPPLLKKYSGSWMSGKDIIAEYDYKVGDSWKKKGSKSMIYHRSFKDKPTAGNGTRPGFVALEEVGFMGNLQQALGQLKECTMNGSVKFGTIWMFGTGGAMESGATEAVQHVFYNPEQHDCLVFDDEWENKGKVGYFVPAWRTLNQYKDKDGYSDKEAALGYLIKTREKLAEGKTKQPLYDELQQRPIKPSEVFLLATGNIFPIAELKDHLANLESTDQKRNLGTTGWMHRDDEGKAIFKVDHDLIPATFPTKESSDPKSAVVVWESPIDNPPYGLYIAGIDPYDQDKADSSVSYGSIFIYKRFKDTDQTYHLPVAEYTGRPDFANDFYEQCRRLLEWYNCKALYENQNTGIKQYFQTKYCLERLHTQPNIIKSISPNSKVERGYGIHMTGPIKDDLEIKCRDWLRQELAPGILQLTKITSIPLIRELIAYNKDGNFDRVIAFMLCIIQNVEMHNIEVDEIRTEVMEDNFFNKRLFI